MYSVIIPTLNRAGSLKTTLESIDVAAKGHIVEIIVVNNGSTDETASVLEKTELRHAKLRSAFLDIPGVCRAKNVGIKVAQYDILVFTDDDCRLQDDYFSSLSKLYTSTEPEPRIIGGKVELGDPLDAPITIKTDLEAANYGVSTGEFPGGFLHGCNLTMTKTVLERVGLWDERFGPGAAFVAAEDSDMIYRAFKAGIKVRYEPSLVVHHFHGRRGREAIIGLNRKYQFGNGALLGKHRDILLTKHFYWNFRNWLREFSGGPIFDDELGLSHGDLVKNQARGFLAYIFRKHRK